jgi:hypothetical protein
MKKTGIPLRRLSVNRSVISLPPMVRSWSIFRTIRSLSMIALVASRAR